MGLFLASTDTSMVQDEMTARQQFVNTAKQMGRRSWGSAKSFAVMGLIFSAAECVVEKVSISCLMHNCTWFFILRVLIPFR